MNDDARFGWQFERDAEPPWTDWPRCPRCGAPRETACPTCDVPRADFPLAELNPAAEFLPALDAAPERPDHQRRHGGGCCSGTGALTGCSMDRDALAADDDGQEAAEPPDAPSAATDDGPGVMLICPTCDEAFSPRFYRWCENCGHDFGSGREDEPPEESDTNFRVVAAIVVTIGVLAGLWIYLVWLFRS